MTTTILAAINITLPALWPPLLAPTTILVVIILSTQQWKGSSNHIVCTLDAPRGPHIMLVVATFVYGMAVDKNAVTPVDVVIMHKEMEFARGTVTRRRWALLMDALNSRSK
jgi:hypothetical protein